MRKFWNFPSINTTPHNDSRPKTHKSFWHKFKQTCMCVFLILKNRKQPTHCSIKCVKLKCLKTEWKAYFEISKQTSLLKVLIFFALTINWNKLHSVATTSIELRQKQKTDFCKKNLQSLCNSSCFKTFEVVAATKWNITCESVIST